LLDPKKPGAIWRRAFFCGVILCNLCACVKNLVPLSDGAAPRKPPAERNSAAHRQVGGERVPANVFPFTMSHCLDAIGASMGAVPELVYEATRGSNWGQDFKLSEQYAVALEFPAAAFFFLKLDHKQLAENDLKKVSKLIAPNPKDIYCGDWRRHNGSDSVAIIKLENRDSSWNPITYQFITARRKPAPKQERWHQIALVVGDILLLQEKNLTKNTAEEIQRTIVHEGLHLFGQSRVVSNEPEMAGATLGPRASLEHLDAVETPYRDSVTQEVCVETEMMKLVLSDNRDYKMLVALKLQEVFQIMFERQRKFDTSKAEAYWYFIEGVPQYLDQKFIFKRNPSKVQNLYENYCTRSGGAQNGFYANYAGAAILHGLEFVLGSQEQWRLNVGFERASLDDWLLDVSEILDSHISVQ